MEATRVVAALQCVVDKSIKDEAAMGLPRDIADRSIADIIATVEQEYSNKSQNRQTTLRNAAHKIKLRRGRQVKDYINKHRRLQDNIKEAGLPEADFEQLTIHAIMDGTALNGTWNAFRI